MTTNKQDPLNLILVLEGNGEEVLPYDPDTVADHVNAIDQVSDNADAVREAGTEAGELHEATEEAEQEAEKLEDLRDVVQVINDNETWSPESFTLLKMQMESMTARLGIDKIDFGVSIEDIVKNGPKVKLSLEEVNKILDAINESAINLEERSITALVDLINALGDAVPKVFTRLSEIGENAQTKNDRPNPPQVSFEQSRVVQNLVVNNEVPVPLSTYINEYCKYGDTLLTKYSEVSFQSVMQAGLFQTGITELTFAGFWDGIDEKLKQIKDPRRELTAAQIAMTLPGAGPLFQPVKGDGNAPLLVRDRLKSLIESNSPVSLSAFSAQVQAQEGATTLPALQPSEIRDCVRYLTDMGQTVNIKTVADSCKAAWVDASRTIRMVRETLKSCDDSLLAALDGDEQLLPRYLSTLFTLSAWPILNYLTNVAIFGNAFCDYAQTSLQAAAGAEEKAAIVEDLNVAVNVVIDGVPKPKDDGVAAVETEEKPTVPDEVPDTGLTPDQPQDATGEGERAVVEGVGETIESGATDAAADGIDVSEGAATEGEVDVSGTAEEEVPDFDAEAVDGADGADADVTATDATDEDAEDEDKKDE